MLLRTLLPTLTFALAIQAAQTPKGIAPNDWQQIRALYAKHQHGAVRQPDGSLAARNPGQQWKLHFDGRGFRVQPEGEAWSWGLELQRFGLAGQEQTAGKAHSEARENRVSYQRPGLEEWFVNDGRGLEQGFTVARKPAGTGDSLVFDLAVRGELFARVAERSVSFTDGAGRAALTFGGLKAWDADGRALAAVFEKTDSGIRYCVDAAGARYPVTVDPVAQQAYLKASNTETSDFFGRSVAISGDTVVVGADFEASNATGVNGNQADNSMGSSGAAYVFVRTAGVWSQQAYLKASNNAAGIGFGQTVAISGDTVVVGAPAENSNAIGVNGNQNNALTSSSGAAYVFTRSGTSWSQQAYLKASNTGAFDFFGWSVSIDNDTVIVGAIRESSNATGVNGAQNNDSADSSGAAYVFTRSGTSWSQQAYLKASNTGPSQAFGWSVAINGDTALVGAYNEASNGTGVNGTQTNTSASGSGAAYVFTRSGTSWSQQAYLKASNSRRNFNFGFALAVSGDTAVVGAFGETSNSTGINGNQADTSVPFAGAAYVFTRSGTAWAQQAYLKPSNAPGNNYNFGVSVAISGDNIIVGAPGEASNGKGVNGNQADQSAPGTGAAYVFTRSAGQWSQHAYLKASNAEAGDEFGSAVAISGNTVVVSAPNEASNATGINGNQANNGATFAGAAYMFNIFPGALSITGGGGLSAAINTAFTNQFQVTLRDSNNQPVPDVIVTFSVPMSGASGTFAGGVNTATTNAQGVATAPVFTANGTAGGPYSVTASIIGGTNTVDFAPTNTSGNANQTVQITVTTNLNGPQVTVNGSTPFTGTQTFSLTPGAALTLGAASPQLFNGGQSRYAFQNWSPSNPTTVPSSATTYTANFSIQHQVTLSAQPTNGGAIGQPSGFFTQGTQLNVSAAANPGFFFAGFNGALTGSTASQMLTVNAPASVVANFSPVGTLSSSDGSGQSIGVNTAFPKQFQVTVRDANSNPIPNVTVTFTPPFTGAGGTFAGGVNTATTDNQGLAIAQIFTANNTPGGPYNVTASIPGGTNSLNFSLTNLPGNNSQSVQVTVATNINGPQVTVNGGTPFTGSQTFTLTPGAALTLGATTPQSFNNGQSRYVFQNWSPSNPTTVPSSATTYTANFGFQHQVTFTAQPTNGGTIQPVTGFFDQGATPTVIAAANNGFSFSSFSGALAGSTNLQTLTVTGPSSVTANFNATGLVIPADSYQVRYLSNLNLGDSVINLTNTGARGAGLAAGTSASTTGAICANIYAFSPGRADGQLLLLRGHAQRPGFALGASRSGQQYAYACRAHVLGGEGGGQRAGVQ